MTWGFVRNRYFVGALIAVVVVLLVLALRAHSHKNEGCGPVSQQVCEQVRVSDEDECQAGEVCGLPLVRRGR